jgi:hypothetical protein
MVTCLVSAQGMAEALTESSLSPVKLPARPGIPSGNIISPVEFISVLLPLPKDYVAIVTCRDHVIAKKRGEEQPLVLRVYQVLRLDAKALPLYYEQPVPFRKLLVDPLRYQLAGSVRSPSKQVVLSRVRLR